MKRVLSLCLALSLVFCFVPFKAFAKVDLKDKELQAYLNEIGMSESEFVEYLNDVHDYSLKDFDDVDDLKEYLGEVLNDENLQSLLDEFELSKEELNELLAEIDASVDDYVFYDDLYFEVLYLLDDEDYLPIDEEELKQLEAELENLLKSFGLTKEEAKNLEEHLNAVIEKNIESDEFFNRLDSLGERLLSLPEFESADDLSAKNIAELLSVWDELLDLLELKTEFYLVKDGKETPISINSLIKLETTNGADLLIKIYSKDGKFLADMIITKEMFDSQLTEKAGANLVQAKETVKKVSGASKNKKQPQKPKTVNGAKLPKTASDGLQNAFVGLAIMMVGFLLFRKLKGSGAI